MLTKAGMFNEAVPQILAFRQLFGGMEEASKNPNDIELMKQAVALEALLQQAGTGWDYFVVHEEEGQAWMAALDIIGLYGSLGYTWPLRPPQHLCK